jgi:hypothetical protein
MSIDRIPACSTGWPHNKPWGWADMDDTSIKVSIKLPLKLAREVKAFAAYRGLSLSQMYEKALVSAMVDIRDEAKAA